MFGRRPLSGEEFKRLAVFANEASIVIKNAQLFTEVQQLKDRLRAENLYLREEIIGKSQSINAEVFGATESIKACGVPIVKDHALGRTTSLLRLRRYLAEGCQMVVL